MPMSMSYNESIMVSWCQWFHGFIGFVVSRVSWFRGVSGFMVSWFPRFRGVNGFIVSYVSWFHGFIVSCVSWFHRFRGVNGFTVSQVSDKFAKHCHTPLNLRIHLVFWCLSSNRHFGTLTLKFLLKHITKETMTNLQNTVKRLGVIVFRKCFAADRQIDVLELLL